MLDEARARAACPDLAPRAPLAQLVEHAGLRRALRAALDELGRAATGSADRVTRMLVLTDRPSIDRGEITDKGSLHQRAMLDSRRELVERLHAARAATDPSVILPSRYTK